SNHMQKLLTLCSFVLLGAGAAHAQTGKTTDDLKTSLQTENKDTVAWLHEGIITLGFNQGFMHNWAAGGEVASAAVSGVFHGSLTYLNHGVIWSNNLDMTYGLNYIYSNNFVPRKTADRIDFTSKLGSRLNKSTDFFYTDLFNARTQFTQ